MRISWLPPDVAAEVREALLRGAGSWDALFDSDGVRAGSAPEGLAIAAEDWPRVAAHVARAERVREVMQQSGLEAAARRFAASPHAVERAALLEGGAGDADDIMGLLACEIDEYLAYGQFLSRLVELGIARQPEATVAAFERFVAAASAVESRQPSWPERLRVARDGLAQLYVRVGRHEDAEAIYRERYREEPDDMTVAIGAGRAFLEAGETGRAVTWLQHAAQRAHTLGRSALEARLREKVVTLRSRVN